MGFRPWGLGILGLGFGSHKGSSLDEGRFLGPIYIVWHPNTNDPSYSVDEFGVLNFKSLGF